MANDQSKKLAVDVIARIDKLEKGMAKAKKVSSDSMGAIEKRGALMTSRLDAQFAKIGSGLKGNVLGFFTGIGSGALAALAPVALFNTALKTIDDASRLVDVADRIGLTTTALQELSFGFSQAGVDQATFETGLEQFSKRIGEAATKGGRLADILKANGIAIRDTNGQIKSSEQLLASYAELVRNAASEQERMVLVTEAFGKGGGDFLNALNDGAAGINNMKKAAEDAGGVIDEQLLRRAEELGDRWDAAWRRFSVSAQSAILTAIEGLDGLNSRMNEFLLKRQAAEMGSLAGSLVGQPGDVVTGPGRSDKPDAIDTRIAQAFGGEIQKADTALVDALQKRYGAAASKATIIPGEKSSGGGGGAGGGRNAAAAAAIREAEAVLSVIEGLKEEQALIGATEVEREKANALRQAGSAATAAQRAEIEQLVEAIYRERAATEAAADASQELRDIGKDVLGGMISDLRAGQSGAEALAGALDKVANKLLEIGLDSLFSGSGGGFGGIFSVLGFAKGGYTGNGSKNQPAGVVHKGEVVFSQDDVKRFGGAENVERMRRGYASGGLVSAIPSLATPRIAPAGNQNRPQVVELHVVGEPGPEFIPTIQAHSRDVAVKVTQAGLGRFDKALPGKMPGLIASAQSRRL
ncbi:hypothetical protein [Mesorhizobium sp. AA22]|uniref:hypothetical protein n=1 Tax=Mesorhizobium sp. AA22 TaxID=1854057 RepID=UPI0007ECE420|nr:hypothetical protein [Mesorhizobium sp. AA22]QIA23091.1 hypothetical protein A9K68_015910 [Mesorhizobium sp. AA22]